ncbi:hypothetical protein SPRG_22095 [Saprolegnia parasitica CBS 223.65]|uniref:Ribosomal protein S6 n=1 Tax=Saprolegnia parasitica (strain CBS 223.65) TaxID=695850 RepID=A0A067D4H8_SAPPC|nr:hypothetical protein SPRG_22095 [Saprolegnia parasitica CBS 223.65]KDO33621.1 hypothetical protein SPRG_22095 [Saprolegnia parasitica CBS 223.65]|eukprot:XP_012195773.1 hypothetical protein SPRG_22095 [Saprolegnia parasitica CBS 223.65]
MVLYKQVILTNLKSSPAETAKMFQELSGFLLGRGGVVRDLANRGHRVLGYPIDDRRWGGTFERHREAKLVVKTFETNPTTLKELEAKMKLSYPVLRFMTFKVDKDPLRNVLKQSTLEPAVADEANVNTFSWEQFQASLNDNVKVVRTDYIADERNDPMANMNIADYVSEDADNDDDDAEVDDEDEPLTAQQQEMADWLVEKAGKSDILKTEEIIHALENATKPAKSDNVEYWDDDDFDFEDDDSAQDKDEKVEHDWQKDSSYVPPVPRPTKK